MKEKESKETVDLRTFIVQERARMDKQKRDYMESHDMADYWKAPKGTTSVTLLARMPRLTKGNFGERMAFRIQVDDASYDWAINQNSPLYRLLIEKLEKAPVVLQVTRVGEEKSTRYEVLEK